MRNLVLSILVVFLKLLYLPMKLLKVKNKITYMSRESNIESIDSKIIRRELKNKYPEYEYKVVTKRLEERKGITRQLLPSIGNIFAQMYHLATSKVIILDTYCITVGNLSHKKETTVVQIWHALGAIKKFGYQTLDNKSGSNGKTAKIMKMHRNYDYVLAPSEETAKIYEKAFNIEKNKIIYIGMPRIDYILEENPDINVLIYDSYPELKNEQKQNILYVPTYRKDEKVYLDELVEKIDTNKYNLIVKLHPLDLRKYKYMQKQGVIYEEKFNVYDLLKISDKVITDYSSLSIEASLRDLPIYFYIYDLEKYSKENGINFDFENEPIGKYKAEKVDELLELIDEKYDYTILKEFKNKYITVNTENVTEELIEFMLTETKVKGKEYDSQTR